MEAGGAGAGFTEITCRFINSYSSSSGSTRKPGESLRAMAEGLAAALCMLRAVASKVNEKSLKFVIRIS